MGRSFHPRRRRLILINMPSNQVGIIGAGLCGLTLGRCLLSTGVPTFILEKASASQTRHNYGIDLSPSTLKRLLRVLQIPADTFCDEVILWPSGKPHARFHHLTSSKDGEKVAPDCIRCHRGRLESMLSRGLDIRWNHAAQRVEKLKKGFKVSVDGRNPIECFNIIAADGVHSGIRNVSLKGNRLRIHSYVVYYGIRQISRERYEDIFAEFMEDALASQSKHQGILLRIFVDDFTTTHVSLGYTYSRPSMGSDSLHRPNRALADASNTPKEFYEELETLRDIPTPFQKIFDPSCVQKDRVLHWLMRSSVPDISAISELAYEGLLLLGDAAHATPILGSKGAERAIEDAIDLAESIDKNGMKDLGEFVKSREEKWLEEISAGVRRLEEMHDIAASML